MEMRGWARSGSNKILCPMHGDHNTSAVQNSNNIYCFVCCRTYGLYDFQQAFGVELERVPEEGGDSMFLDIAKGKAGYSYNQVLFSYNFQVKEL